MVRFVQAVAGSHRFAISLMGQMTGEKSGKP
jgi:hypothetical protein